MIMRTYFPGGDIINFDSWMGYPTERQELVGHIKRKKIKDVVFVTGDIHTFVAGDVRLNDTDKRALATEFVGGSITAPGPRRGRRRRAHGRRPVQPQDARRGSSSPSRRPTPGSRTPTSTTTDTGWRWRPKKDFRCTLKRVAQIKKPGQQGPADGRVHYRMTRGRPSLLD